MTDCKIVDVKEASYLYAERSCSMDPDDIGGNMENAFRTVGAFVESNGIGSIGRALSVYPTYDEKTMTFRAGFLVSVEDAAEAKDGATAEDGVKAGLLPAGRALNTIHRGPYALLRVTYAEMMTHMEENGMTFGIPTWEIYLNNPDSVASENELETDIYVMLAEG